MHRRQVSATAAEAADSIRRPHRDGSRHPLRRGGLPGAGRADMVPSFRAAAPRLRHPRVPGAERPFQVPELHGLPADHPPVRVLLSCFVRAVSLPLITSRLYEDHTHKITMSEEIWIK